MFVCEKGVVCGCLGVWEELVVVRVRDGGGVVCVWEGVVCI